MDSLTHIAIGAVIGDAFAGKSIGKKAMLAGAIFQSIPDIDFIASFFLSPTDNLLAHRGFTHSLLFGVIITLSISYGAIKWKQSQKLGFNQWMMFAGIEIFVHLLLDACNAYGVGWFEPFSNHRLAFNFIFVVDPFYSMALGIAAVMLWLLPDTYQNRTRWITFGLLISSCYLFMSVVNKIVVNRAVEKTLVTEHLEYKRYFTTPTAFNNLLWYCVVENDSGYHIGYRSIFDDSDRIRFTFFPQNRFLLNGVDEDQELSNLLRFSKGYYTVEKTPDALIFNDLRFGRIAGWESRQTEFAFHYYLQRPGENLLVVQRGRLAEWNLSTMKSMLHRIRGE